MQLTDAVIEHFLDTEYFTIETVFGVGPLWWKYYMTRYDYSAAMRKHKKPTTCQYSFEMNSSKILPWQNKKQGIYL